MHSRSHPGDTLARFGGDEFALLMPRVASEQEPEQVAQRLLTRLAEDLEPLPAGLRVTASVGLALSPVHGATPEELLRAADAAMYRAKLAGGERFDWPGPVDYPPFVAGEAEANLRGATAGR